MAQRPFSRRPTSPESSASSTGSHTWRPVEAYRRQHTDEFIRWAFSCMQLEGRRGAGFVREFRPPGGVLEARRGYSLSYNMFWPYMTIIRDVNQVHDMMDDIAEQLPVVKEISEAISNPVAFGQDVDQDELERELEELLDVGASVDDLPSVPTTDIARPTASTSKAKSRTEEEEDEYMKELQQWAS